MSELIKIIELIEDEDGSCFKAIINKGLNDSITHVDFMIGSSDLSIKGYTFDGKEIEVFKNGTWNI